MLIPRTMAVVEPSQSSRTVRKPILVKTMEVVAETKAATEEAELQ